MAPWIEQFVPDQPQDLMRHACAAVSAPACVVSTRTKMSSKCPCMPLLDTPLTRNACAEVVEIVRFDAVLFTLPSTHVLTTCEPAVGMLLNWHMTQCQPAVHAAVLSSRSFPLPVPKPHRSVVFVP